MSVLAIVSDPSGASASVVRGNEESERFRPLPGRVLLREREFATKSASGIHFGPSDWRDATRIGRATVIAHGGECGVQVGDDVLFDRLGEGTVPPSPPEYIKLGDAKFHLVKAETIVGVLEP